MFGLRSGVGRCSGVCCLGGVWVVGLFLVFGLCLDCVLYVCDCFVCWWFGIVVFGCAVRISFFLWLTFTVCLDFVNSVVLLVFLFLVLLF